MTHGGLTQIDSKMREWKHRETTQTTQQQRRRSDLVEDRRGGEDLSWGKIQPYDSPFTEEDLLELTGPVVKADRSFLLRGSMSPCHGQLFTQVQ